MYRDLSAYRNGRTTCKLVENYKAKVKPTLLATCLNKLPKINKNVAEIVMDTFLGWFNSPVGRSFAREVLYEKKYKSFREGWRKYYEQQMVTNVIFRGWKPAKLEDSMDSLLVRKFEEDSREVIDFVVNWLDSEDATKLFCTSFGEVVVMDYSEGE